MNHKASKDPRATCCTRQQILITWRSTRDMTQPESNAHILAASQLFTCQRSHTQPAKAQHLATPWLVAVTDNYISSRLPPVKGHCGESRFCPPLRIKSRLTLLGQSSERTIADACACVKPGRRSTAGSRQNGPSRPSITSGECRRPAARPRPAPPDLPVPPHPPSAGGHTP